MEKWWENDPVVEEDSNESWWEADPIAGEEIPTEESIVEEDTTPVWDKAGYDGVPGRPSIDPALTEQYEQYGMGQTGDLPVPTTDMFEESGNPRRLYEMYEEHPETTTSITGQPVFRNTVVPFPEPDITPAITNALGGDVEQTYDVNTQQLVGLGARGVVKNAIVTGGAIIDEIAGQLGIDSNLAQSADELIASRPSSGQAYDALVMEGTEIAAGVIAGYKVGNKAGKELKSWDIGMTDKMAAVLAGFGSMVGSAITMHPNTQTLTVGDDSLSQEIFGGSLLDGVEVDEDGKFSSQILAKKMNILLDEMTLGFGIETAGKWGMVTGEFLKNITYDQIKPMWSEGSRQRQILTELLESLNSNTQEGIKRIRDIVSENKQVIIDIADENIDNVKIERTTMSAINEGINDPFLETRSMELEQGITGRGATMLENRLSRPLNEFEVFQQQAIDSRGGGETIEKARETIAQSGVDDIQTARKSVMDQENVVLDSEESVRKLLREDPIFGETVQRMEAAAGIDTKAQKVGATRKVMENIKTAVGNLTEAKNKLYSAIPEDAPIHMESFAEAIKNADEYLPKPVRDIVADAERELDFKTLNNDILPQVNKRISQLMNTSGVRDQDAIDALMGIRDNINKTQMDFLEMSDNADVRNAAKAAKTYYREDYLPFAGADSPTGKLFDQYQNEYVKKDILQEVAGSVSDEKIGTSEAVLDLLSRPEAGGKPEDIVDVYLGDVAANWSKKLSDSEGIDNLDAADLITGLGEKGTMLKERFPEQAAQIETLVNRLKEAKGDVKLQQEILKEVQVAAREKEEYVFNSALRNFIKRGPEGEILQEENGYNVIKGMLSKETSSTELDDIIDRVNASGDPVAKRGLESAFFTYLQEITQNSSTGLNKRAMDRIVDPGDIKSLWDYGKKIFDNPKILDSYRTVVETVLTEKTKRGSKAISMSAPGILADSARSAIGLVVKFTLGVLNPTATKVTSGTNTLLRRFNPSDRASIIMEKIHADPDYTLKLLDDLEKSLNSGMKPEAKRQLWKIGIYTGMYAEEDKDDFDQSWEEQAKEFFPSKKTPVDEDMEKLK